MAATTSSLDPSWNHRKPEHAHYQWVRDGYAKQLMNYMAHIMAYCSVPRAVIDLKAGWTSGVIEMIYSPAAQKQLLQLQYMLEIYQRDYYPELFPASSTPTWANQ